jgi:hypothetical protein
VATHRKRRFKLGPIEVRVETTTGPPEEPLPSTSPIDVDAELSRLGGERETRHKSRSFQLTLGRRAREVRPKYGTGAKILVAGLVLVLLGGVLKAFSFDAWEAPLVAGGIVVVMFRWRLRDVWPEDFPILRRLLGR